MSARAKAAGYVIGTSCFVSSNRARRYYAIYGYSATEVRIMIAEGSIAIGKPRGVPAENIFVIENEGRYAIRVNH